MKPMDIEDNRCKKIDRTFEAQIPDFHSRAGGNPVTATAITCNSNKMAQSLLGPRLRGDDGCGPVKTFGGAMKVRQQARMLPGGRLHLQDGPIDLIIGADGEPSDVERAYAASTVRFATLLNELCEELTLLRAPAMPGGARLAGPVARRMERAVSPFAAGMFITPMAAVAGAVAEEILEATTGAASLIRAYVNNGGDIALHLGAGATFTIGLITRPDRPSLFGTTRLTAKDGIAGIATSGWRGRSFSLGIADAVTVLAASAAQADAAATVVANAVDLPGHASVVREPACNLQPDSDLGQRLVTRQVRTLSNGDILKALKQGADCALDLIRRDLIRGAALHLQGVTKIVSADAQPPLSWPGLTRPSTNILEFSHAL